MNTPSSSSSKECLQESTRYEAPPPQFTTSMENGSRLWRILKSWGVEPLGIVPVAPDKRTDRNLWKLFGFWNGMSINLLPVVTGILAPTAFELSLRDASLIIIFFSILCAAPVAYLGSMAPGTGLRQMIQSRYTFGYYVASITTLLNIATLLGFCVVGAVVGGQSLSSVSDGRLSWNVGIVVIAILSLVISFGGYKFVHNYERYSPIPVLICIIILTVNSRHELALIPSAVTPPATTSSVLSFAGIIAGFYIPYAGNVGDFGTYYSGEISTMWFFFTTLMGLIVPNIPLLILGAAFGSATQLSPALGVAYESGSIGELLAALLKSLGGFGKFVLVIISFSTAGNLAGTAYAIGLSFECLIEPWLGLIRGGRSDQRGERTLEEGKVEEATTPGFEDGEADLGGKKWGLHRGVWAIVTIAIVIPVSIRAASSFFSNLEDFIAIIAYWSSAFLSILIIEHIVFKRLDHANYPQKDYNRSDRLPLGFAGILAGALSFALAIPCMSQIWYTGPIGEKIGDFGFEAAYLLSAILYIPLRYLERRWTPGRL